MAHSARGTAQKGIEEKLDNEVTYKKREAMTIRKPDPAAVAEVARYIAQLSAEMSQMAAEVKLDTLAYFLSMARLEAEMLARAPLER